MSDQAKPVEAGQPGDAKVVFAGAVGGCAPNTYPGDSKPFEPVKVQDVNDPNKGYDPNWHGGPVC
jgi:hypothetical protein